MRVLVVDDDPDVRRIARIGLRQAGHEVEEAPDGESALQLAAQERPDVIVLDIMMPRRDGFSVLEELQVLPETEDIPVIILSALSGSDDRKRGFEAGAEDYIVKPYSPDELNTAVRRVAGEDAFGNRWACVQELSSLLGDGQDVSVDPWGACPR